MDNVAKPRRRPKFLDPEEECFFNKIESLLPYHPITDADAFDVFPEAKSVVLKLLKNTRQKIEDINKENRPKFDEAMKFFYMHDGREEYEDLFTALAHFWYFEIPAHVRTEIKGNRPVTVSLQDEVARLERIIKLHTIRHAIKNSPDEVNELTIKNAKEVQMGDLLIGEKPNHAGFIRCPFHNEKTASCKIEKNRFHCFGCGADGDVIDWVMKMEGKDFLTAVRELNRRR